MTTTPSHDDARAALSTVERSRRRVIDEIDMPTWYWWGLALGWIALGVVTDLQYAWFTAVATLAFGATHSAVAQRVIDGRHRTNRLSVRFDVVGRRAALAMFLALIGLALVTVVVAVSAAAAGVSHPATLASIVVALLILLGGPRLMATIRHRAARSLEQS